MKEAAEGHIVKHTNLVEAAVVIGTGWTFESNIATS
jgi:hypothetical protein